MLSAEDLRPLAERLWQGFPRLWEEELRLFALYEASVDQELTEEGLALWLTRVQARRCPVAGEACDKPRHGRFCERHRLGAPLGM